MFHGENLAEQGTTVPDSYWHTIAESMVEHASLIMAKMSQQDSGASV